MKGQHKKGARGYGERGGVGRECSTTLATKGRGGHEGEAVGRNGHTQGGGFWGWTVLEEGGRGLRQAREGKGEQIRGKGVLQEPEGGGGWACVERRGQEFNTADRDDQKTTVGTRTDGTGLPWQEENCPGESGTYEGWRRVAGAASGSAGRRHHRPLPVPSVPRPVRGP